MTKRHSFRVIDKRRETNRNTQELHGICTLCGTRFVTSSSNGPLKYMDPADEQMSLEMKLQIVQHYANKLRDDSKIEHRHS
ncbi:uncharacterized protein Dvir_GJ26611 [Drosophila virilis]|uniref:Uncharacterized protein n=1 Tax=Drosophila virilis TaxID=7244 RepID=A0A0Q9WRT3_DROVI|nr:uncharacterized protein Dvir_GJ26611 [Drosophila virilis]